MIYSSWDIEQNKLKLLILGHFLPFYPPKNLKNQNFEKWKNLLEILSFYTSVPKITLIWCTVPQIQSETENIFYHSGPFFALLPPRPTPLMILKIKILKKKKWKRRLETLSFYRYMCTINVDHMTYSSWNIRCNRPKCLSFWAIFCPFSPLTTRKIKILQLKKTSGDIIIF